jgi:hypothetical protein
MYAHKTLDYSPDALYYQEQVVYLSPISAAVNPPSIVTGQWSFA